MGGFALHKVTPPTFKGRCSAWFDADGNLLDAEQIIPRSDGNETERSVKRGGPIWEYLQGVGRKVWRTNRETGGGLGA